MSMLAARPKSVAIVGGGATGLIAAYLSKKYFEKVCVFEKTNDIGGLWRYRPKIDASYGPVYRGLRANLPSRLMEIPEFPFEYAGSFPSEHRRSGEGLSLKGAFGTGFILGRTDSNAPSSFPHHSEVLKYLEDFSTAHRLEDLISFETEVVNVAKSKHGYAVEARKSDDDDAEIQEFDVVINCGGRFEDPYLPEGLLPASGADVRVTHSKAFDDPADYAGKNVVVIGCGSSGRDIVAFLEPLAKNLCWVASDRILKRLCGYSVDLTERRYSLFPTVAAAIGSLASMGDPVHVIYATGYRYSFPHLSEALEPAYACSRKTSLEYKQFVPESGFTKPRHHDNFGFIGAMPVSVPLGLAYYQAKLFLHHVFGEKCEEGYSRRDVHRTVRCVPGARGDPADIGLTRQAQADTGLRQGDELSFAHLLPYAVEARDFEDLAFRSDFFDFCEGRILGDFHTYRDWHYVVSPC